MIINPINLRILQSEIHRMMLNGVQYKLGAKADLIDPNLGLGIPYSRIKKIDCSGLVRKIVFDATDNHLVIPDGSWNQRDWADKHLEKIVYSDIGKRADHSGLYLAQLNPVSGKAGHIWFVRTEPGHIPETYESHGGRGPDNRPWNTSVLRNNVDNCWVWPHFWE